MMSDNMDMDGIIMNDMPENGSCDLFSQPSSQIPDTQCTQIEGEISQTYEGAPQEVTNTFGGS